MLLSWSAKVMVIVCGTFLSSIVWLTYIVHFLNCHEQTAVVVCWLVEIVCRFFFSIFWFLSNHSSWLDISMNTLFHFLRKYKILIYNYITKFLVEQKPIYVRYYKGFIKFIFSLKIKSFREKESKHYNSLFWYIDIINKSRIFFRKTNYYLY